VVLVGNYKVRIAGIGPAGSGGIGGTGGGAGVGVGAGTGGTGPGSGGTGTGGCGSGTGVGNGAGSGCGDGGCGGWPGCGSVIWESPWPRFARPVWGGRCDSPAVEVPVIEGALTLPRQLQQEID
jgi:hypothetical protein